MLKIIAAAFAGLAIVLIVGAALSRHYATTWDAKGADADRASVSVNDVLLSVDVKSLPGGEFEDASLVFPTAPSHAQDR